MNEAVKAATTIAIQQALSNPGSPPTIPGLSSILLRIHQVEPATGYKKSKIYQMVKDGEFPAPVQLGPKSVAWRSDEVQEWIDALPRVVRDEGGE